MKVLELFSGTGSVGKIAREKGWEVVSLDLENADININILDWDYKKDYKKDYFDVIWSSVPCNTFSHCRRCWVNRKNKYFGDKIITHEMLDNDMIENGLPLLNKTLEIIDYYKPKYYFIENPHSSKLKNYLQHFNHYDIDYCMYSDWGYRKRTRIWTNKKGFNAKLCNKKCGNMIKVGNRNLHKNNLGNSFRNGLTKGSCLTLNERYRIPPNLLNDLLDI